jgi:hypothetical protein
MPTCLFCGEHREKLCKAHILPESFFRAIKLGDEPLMSIPGSEKFPYTQTYAGRWDEEILCSSCDGGTLGKLDDYAARLFLQREFGVHWFQHSNSIHFRMKDVDVSRIKRFWISVLWRHAILTGECGEPEDFSVVLLYFGSPQVIVGMSPSTFGEGWFETYTCGWHVFIKGHKGRDQEPFRPLYLEHEVEPFVIVQDMDETSRFLDLIADFVLKDKAEANRAHADFRRHNLPKKRR